MSCPQGMWVRFPPDPLPIKKEGEMTKFLSKLKEFIIIFWHNRFVIYCLFLNRREEEEENSLKKEEKMARNFRGSNDETAIVLKKVFPSSNLKISTPTELCEPRSRVFIDGEPEHQEIIFEYLKRLLKSNVTEKYFGEWIGLTPPDEFPPRTIIHYEARQTIDNLQLLCFVLPRHLATICDLCLSPESELVVRTKGFVVLQEKISLSRNFPNGNVLLPNEKINTTPIKLFS